MTTTVLPHSGMTVPHDRLRVTSLSTLPGAEAYTAVLRLDTKRVGIVVDHGTGGGPRYVPDSPAGPFRAADLAAYVELCKTGPAGDEDVSTELALAFLVEEYETGRTIARLTRHGDAVARLVGPYDNSIVLRAVTAIPAAPEGRERLGRHLVAEVELSHRGAVWQGWTGTEWVNLYRFAPRIALSAGPTLDDAVPNIHAE